MYYRFYLSLNSYFLILVFNGFLTFNQLELKNQLLDFNISQKYIYFYINEKLIPVLIFGFVTF